MRDLDKKRASNRAYYRRMVLKGENPSKEWRNKNIAKDIEWRRRYYHEILKHDPKHKARVRKYYLKTRDIQRQRQKDRRSENPEYYKSVMVRLRQRRNDFVNRAKMRPCADCGIQYNPWVMHFDHRDPSQKKNCISMIKSHSFENLKVEIAKCDVVCANCHCERTHKQWISGFISRTGKTIKTLLR